MKQFKSVYKKKDNEKRNCMIEGGDRIVKNINFRITSLFDINFCFINHCLSNDEELFLYA